MIEGYLMFLTVLFFGVSLVLLGVGGTKYAMTARARRGRRDWPNSTKRT